MYKFPLFEFSAEYRDDNLIKWIIAHPYEKLIHLDKYPDVNINEYINSIKETQKITSKYIVGSSILLTNDSKNPDEPVNTYILDIIEHYVGKRPSLGKVKYIKKRGRIDDAHTSRFDIVLDKENNKVWKVAPFNNNESQLNEDNLIKLFRLNRVSNEYEALNKYFFRYKDYEVSVSDLIFPDKYLTPQQEIKIYSNLFKKDLANLNNDELKYTHRQWCVEFEEVLEKLIKMKILSGSLSVFLKLIKELKTTFNETFSLNHGDPKIFDHLICQNEKIYVLDLERMLITTKMYDSSKLSVVCERLGYSFLLPVIYENFDISTASKTELHVTMELFHKLREIMRIFADPNLMNSSMAKVPEKKYRDLRIFENSISYHLKRLNTGLVLVDMEGLFGSHGFDVTNYF